MDSLVNIGAGISAVLNLETLTVILLGLTAGLLVGALPGLTATMAVAILVPLSFGLEPVPALSMLLAVYVGAISGGAVSAILINTPGTPASVATTLDGYPMARQGNAGKALGWAMLGSIVGSVIGILVLILLAPVIAEAALRFSAPEYAAIALLGLTMAVGIAGRDLIKGIMAAVLGLFVGMVGLDPMLGYERFTFGTLELLGGFSFVAVLIGLFAISEALNQATRIDGASRLPPVPRGIFPKAREFLAHRWLLLKSGLIGTAVGALPGVGADVASIVSYNEAKRSSKHPERFGRGAEEGVIASETANNAVVGGALIPLLTLAIPGDAVTAVLLGALMMHGLRAGPLLFQENPDEVIAMYVALIVAVIFLRIIGIAMIRVFARVVNINQSYLIPGILLFCFVGSYAVANNVFDVSVAVGFGILGFVMQRYGYPVAPTVLALILGPLAEEKLRQSLVMSQGSWLIFLERPITVALLVLAGLSLVFAIRQQRRLAAMQEQLAAGLGTEPERR